MSMSIPNQSYDILDNIEDVLKNWELYKLIIRDIRNMDKYPGIERYRHAEHIIKCVDERKEYLSRKECRYLELKYFMGKSYEQIAKSLRISPRSVANWRIRILFKIAKRGALI